MHLVLYHLDVDPVTGDTVELAITVEGMMCGGCTSRVEEALKVRSTKLKLLRMKHYAATVLLECNWAS